MSDHVGEHVSVESVVVPDFLEVGVFEPFLEFIQHSLGLSREKQYTDTHTGKTFVNTEHASMQVRTS